MHKFHLGFQQSLHACRCVKQGSSGVCTYLVRNVCAKNGEIVAFFKSDGAAERYIEADIYWTQELPTEPGWYWTRSGEAVSIVCFLQGPKGDLICLERLDLGKGGRMPRPEDFSHVEAWAGPIPEPIGEAK